jgi:hypothetical protein
MAIGEGEDFLFTLLAAPLRGLFSRADHLAMKY